MHGPSITLIHFRPNFGPNCKVLEYRLDFTNLLFCVIWGHGHAWSCPPRYYQLVGKCDVYLQAKKSILSLPSLFDILQRYYKLAIFGTFDMSGYDQ